MEIAAFCRHNSDTDVKLCVLGINKKTTHHFPTFEAVPNKCRELFTFHTSQHLHYS